MKRLIAVVVTWAFLVVIIAAAPVTATEIYSNGGASPEMIEANQLFTGHCSSPFGK